jgi:hypothetical protein
LVGFVAMAPQDVAVVVPHGGGPDQDFAAFIGAFNGSVFDFTHLTMSLWATAASTTSTSSTGSLARRSPSMPVAAS